MLQFISQKITIKGHVKMIHSFFLHNFWFLHSAAGNILPLNSMLNNQDMHRYMIHSPATVFLIVRKPPDTSPRAASLNILLLVLVAYHLLHLGVGQRVQEGRPEVAEGVLHSRHLVVGCGRRAGRSWSIVPPWRTLHPARGRCTAAWRSPRGCCSKDATNEFWLISQIFWLLSDPF